MAIYNITHIVNTWQYNNIKPSLSSHILVSPCSLYKPTIELFICSCRCTYIRTLSTATACRSYGISSVHYQNSHIPYSWSMPAVSHTCTHVAHISYTMGTSALPDIYTWAWGPQTRMRVCIYQAKHWCPWYNHYTFVPIMKGFFLSYSKYLIQWI